MDTQSQFIAAALKLFAEKGFYGASMDQIAREVGLTKQALIHHFGTKEKLYAAVLTEISERLLAEVVENQPNEDAAGFVAAILRIYERTQQHSLDTQLLMRELLDNRSRAEKASTWYLRPFLDGLSGLLAKHPDWKAVAEAERAAHVYQLLGAINYFAVSTATLENMYSAEYVDTLAAVFPQHLERLALVSPQMPAG